MNKRFRYSVISLLLIFSFNQIFAQVQIGSSINGEAMDDQSGNSISLSADGNRVAIGASRNNDAGNLAGHVRIYEWSGSDWIQLGSDIDGEAAGDKSGNSVSLSSDGNRVAIGAFVNGVVNNNAGHVRVYEWNGNNWIQLGFDIDGEIADEQSGWAVAISADGNRIAIGAHFSFGATGLVRIFEWNGVSWNQLGNSILGESSGDYSGTSVSLSSDGSRVSIGAPEKSSQNPGYTRIFEWDNINDNWLQLGSTIYGEADRDESGYAVSLSGDGNRVAIGAAGNDGNTNDFNIGHVQIYEWIDNNWSQIGNDINGEAAGDLSGRSVSLSSNGNRVAIGAVGSQTNGFGSGHVRIYEWKENAWMQLGTDIDGETISEFLGRSVSLSSTGHRVAIGAPGNDENGEDAGQVKIFEMIPVSVSTLNTNKDIELFPNPTTGNLELLGVTNATINIVDNLGRTILSKSNISSAFSLYEIPPGIYFMHITFDGQTFLKKFVKV